MHQIERKVCNMVLSCGMTMFPRYQVRRRFYPWLAKHKLNRWKRKAGRSLYSPTDIPPERRYAVFRNSKIFR